MENILQRMMQLVRTLESIEKYIIDLEQHENKNLNRKKKTNRWNMSFFGIQLVVESEKNKEKTIFFALEQLIDFVVLSGMCVWTKE